jgi:hypothetical protein
LSAGCNGEAFLEVVALDIFTKNISKTTNNFDYNFLFGYVVFFY